MSLVLKMSGMAGDAIEDTCRDMVALAERLDLTVEVQFNDVTLLAHRGGNASDLADDYDAQRASSNTYKLASTGSGQ